MNQRRVHETWEGILQAERVEALSHPELLRLFLDEPGMSGFLPDNIYETEPRNGDRILSHSSRARRPHDNRFAAQTPEPEPDFAIPKNMRAWKSSFSWHASKQQRSLPPGCVRR